MSDPILLWNAVSLEADRVSHTNGRGEQTGPTLSARALAIVHLAMHDAYAASSGDATLRRYLNAPVPAGGPPEDAIAGAAYTALTNLYPSQRPFFEAILTGVATRRSAGFSAGQAAAQAILNDRATDPGVNTPRKPSLLRGRHRPDPDNPNQGFYGAEYGRLSKSFAVRTRWQLAKPPFDNAEYLAALRQVRGLGIKPELMGTLPSGFDQRTPEQTLIGSFWGYDGAFLIGTPPRLYNQIGRIVAEQQGNTLATNAKLFALMNVAMADAGILAWEQKYCHDLWRPVLGIREHDKSMGPATEVARNRMSRDGDPGWLPLGAPNSNRLAKNFTPNFPAYPSGHATFGAASLHTARLFYGHGGHYTPTTGSNLTDDHLLGERGVVSDELNGITSDNLGTVRPRHLRQFPGGLWQMIIENGLSRVYLGVHWVFDAFRLAENEELDLDRLEDGKPTGGVPLGLLIAEDIFAAYEATPAGGEWRNSIETQPQDCAGEKEGSPTFSSQFLL